MKSIRKGRKPGVKIYRAECHCGEIVEADESELTNKIDHLAGDGYSYDGCPTCKDILYFSKYDEGKLADLRKASHLL